MRYLTRMEVQGTFPSSTSRMEYFPLAMRTCVPCAAASFTYSSFARAPFAPLREAPSQYFFIVFYVFCEFVGVFPRNFLNERGRVVRVGIDAVHAREDEQRPRFHETGDEGSGLIVVDALVHDRLRLRQRRDLHAPVFGLRNGVVVVDDGDGVLLAAAQQQRADVRALDGVVEVVVFDEDLPH